MTAIYRPSDGETPLAVRVTPNPFTYLSLCRSGASQSPIAMRKILIVLSSLFALNSAAQSEGGLWLGADASYDITSRLGAELEVGTRLEEGFSRFTRVDAALGFDYKLTRWIKVGAGYDVIGDYNGSQELDVVYRKDPNSPDGIRYDSEGNPVVNGYNQDATFWRPKHRTYFDLTGKWRAGRFSFSLRERYQYTYYAPVEDVVSKYREELEADDLPSYPNPYIGPFTDAYGDDYYYGLERIDDKKGKSRHYLRQRFGVEYNIRRCPVTPFASYEVANDLVDDFSLVRQRVTAGADITLTADKRHALSLAYIYQRGAHEETGAADMHIVSIGYKFSFESALAQRQKKAAKKARKSK